MARNARAPGRRRVAAAVGRNAVGILLVGGALLPILWGIVVSFSTTAGLRALAPPFLPDPVTLDNYALLLGGTNPTSVGYYTALGNSFVQSVATTVITIAVVLPASYALARMPIRGGRAILAILLACLAMPIYLVLIPLFQLASGLGQVNTVQAVVLIFSSAAIPLAVWILRSHIATIPPDLEAAARLDGASTFTLLVSIIRPLVAPGVAAAAVVVFLSTWSTFLIPAVFANTADIQPVTVLIPQFTTRFHQQIGLQAAAGLIAILPPGLVVVFLHRYLVSGLLRGASR